MGTDGVRRVAILGGGMGALAAAFELSDPALEERYEVTVYQPGWRLGGKCASARNPERRMRSEEHGLHIWFGFYRNAFGMLRKTYEALGRPEAHPFRSVEGVFMPRRVASFGSRADDGGPWTVSFPDMGGAPWVDGHDPLEGKKPAQAAAALILRILDEMERWGTHRAGLSAIAAGSLKLTILEKGLGERLRSAAEKLRVGVDEVAIPVLLGDITTLRQGARAPLLAAAHLSEPLRKLWVGLDLTFAVLHGLLDPKDRVLLDGDLGRLDDREFRDWLREHGAWEVNLWSPPVRALYDTAFAYRDGDPRKPAYAAGVATRVILRVLFDYPGSVCYLPRAGFGEVVVQPLFELLVSRGVKFEFFHRVDLIERDTRSSAVKRVRLTRQAKTAKDAPYWPLIGVEVPKADGSVEKFDAWPAAPDWKQLADGDAMKAAGVDLESRWYDRARFPGTPVVLERGEHFDDVVLGIPLHAAREVLAPFADDRVLGAALKKITPVPTVSAQVWMDKPTSDLGWSDPPGLVGAPPPLDIWTDMTQVMDHEPWPAGSKPRSLHYLCGVAPLADVWAPPSDHQVPVRAQAVAEDALRSFLVDASWAIWPNLKRGAPFDWSLLHDDEGRRGEERLRCQFTRANIDPTECCPSSLPGDIGARPEAGGSEVENLFLASDSLRNGLDTSCVESAVMSGRQAARALAGLDYHVAGEDFFARLPSKDRKRGAAALPAYVGWKGLGQMSIPSPVVFDGCTAWAHVLGAKQTALQALVDEKLNAPSGGELALRVPFGVALLVFLYGEKGFVPSGSIGCAQDHEMCFVVPVTYERAGHRAIAFWMPYITVDTAIAMASGRETWGFPKEHGEVKTPGGKKLENLDAHSSALYFGKLDDESPGRFGPIVAVVDDRSGGGVAAAWQAAAEELDASAWLQQLLDFLERTALDAAETAAADLALLKNELEATFGLLRSHASVQQVPIVNLKQFRDAVNDSRACYQAIDLTHFQLSKIGDFAAAAEVAHVEITDAASHDFVRLLGLSDTKHDVGAKATTVAVPLTLGVSFDFQIAGGTILWEAR
jgi:uncharacterized protein with NAD-binding domain and iron-sulfur cluster